MATHKQSKQERAVKMFKRCLIDSQLGIDGIMDEFNLLKTLDHPNILRVYECFEDDRYIYFVTELMAGGELFTKLIDENQFSEDLSIRITS